MKLSNLQFMQNYLDSSMKPFSTTCGMLLDMQSKYRVLKKMLSLDYMLQEVDCSINAVPLELGMQSHSIKFFLGKIWVNLDKTWQIWAKYGQNFDKLGRNLSKSD